jgi:hypothetical protein
MTGVPLLALLSLLACSSKPDEEQAGTSRLNLSLDLTGESDVSSIHFEFLPVECTSGEATGAAVIKSDRALEDMTIPGGVSSLEGQPLDAGSKHVFADSFSTLAAGCYDVSATPLQDDGTPSAICAAANKPKVEVKSGETTEVFLLNQCQGHDKGGIDAIATLNHEPELSVQFESSKFVCSKAPQKICATADDPDKDPVEFVWTVDGAIPTDPPKVLSHDQDPMTGKVTECVQIKAAGSGRYDVHVTAYDQVWRDEKLVRIEDWLAEEGYPSESHAKLDFFFYAADCAASLDAVDGGDGVYFAGVMDVSDDGSHAAGYSYGSTGSSAFRWSSAGFEAVASPSDYTGVYGYGTSADGKLVAGSTMVRVGTRCSGPRALVGPISAR